MSPIKRAVSLRQCDAARRGSHFQLLRVVTTARGKKKEWPLKVKDSLRALVWQYVRQMALLSLSNVFRGATRASRRRTIKSESLVEKVQAQRSCCHSLAWPSFLSNDVNMGDAGCRWISKKFPLSCHTPTEVPVS